MQRYHCSDLHVHLQARALLERKPTAPPRPVLRSMSFDTLERFFQVIFHQSVHRWFLVDVLYALEAWACSSSLKCLIKTTNIRVSRVLACAHRSGISDC